MDRPKGPGMNWRETRVRSQPDKKQATFRMHPDGAGYDALRPTKGWLRVSAKRLRAQAILTQLRHVINLRRMGAR